MCSPSKKNPKKKLSAFEFHLIIFISDNILDETAQASLHRDKRIGDTDTSRQCRNSPLFPVVPWLYFDLQRKHTY